MGFLDLVQDGIDGDLPKKDLDRAMRALSELDLLVTEAQLALRREGGSAESSDLVSVLQQSLEDLARLPGGEGGTIRSRLPDPPVHVLYPEELLRELIGRLLGGSHHGPLDLLLQARLSRPDPQLPPGAYCVLLTRGGRTAEAKEGWSFQAERFRLRSLGGELRYVPEGLLVFLPLID